MQKSLSKPPKHQWALFTSLYTTQYVGVGFMLVALVGILRQRGMELADLSIVYVIGLPWVLKFIWAPLVDFFGYKKWGHYRSWLLVLQFLMVISLLALSRLSLDNQLNLIIIAGTLFVTLSATQDIAVDALASREFDSQQRGFVNGIQSAGGLLGNLIGGGLVLIFYSHIGWQGAFYLMAAVTSVSWFQLLFFRENNLNPIEKKQSVAQTFKHLFTFWRGKGLWFLLIFISVSGFSMIYGILTPMMLDAGKTLSDVGLALNVFGSSIGVLSGIMAGQLIQKIGRKHALKGFHFLQVICFITILPVAFVTNNMTLYFALFVYFIIYPLIAAIMSTLMMDYAAQNTTPGTDYTVQYTLLFFAGMLMAGIGMQIGQYYEYLGVIVTAIVTSLIALMLALIYAKKLPEHSNVNH